MRNFYGVSNLQSSLDAAACWRDSEWMGIALSCGQLMMMIMLFSTMV
jgi:hypothetical protein